MYWLMPWGAVGIEGKDAADFLQRMSTANLNLLPPGEMTHAAFLTGKGTTVALGILHCVSDHKYLYLLPLTHVNIAVQHMEQFHFAEMFEIADKSNEVALFGVREDGGEIRWQIVNAADREGTKLKLEAAGHRTKPGAWEEVRIELGIPEVGKELTAKEIILEGNFDAAVARNKGCYPGQEVVERIFTYGSVNKKLWPVTVSWTVAPTTLPIEFEVAGKWAGALVTIAPYVSDAKGAEGLAYVQKAFWDRKEAFELPEGLKVVLRGKLA